MAREGYVNLLPVQHKNSREPGDSAAALKARRDFLDAGHYRPLRDALTAMARPAGGGAALDIGCGEGWYTSAFVGTAEPVIGLDIARAGIRLAARRYRGVTWLVGSGVLLPLADGCVDLVTSIFSHLHPLEMHRVLAARGRAIIVVPGPDHLWTLREALFDEVRPHQPEKAVVAIAPRFDLEERLEVRVPIRLSTQGLRQLLLMTPYAWRAKPDRRAELESRPWLETEAVFSLMRFGRKDVVDAAA